MSVAVLAPATWGPFSAFRLANAHLEAVVVPALGRVMRFARAGAATEANLLWTDELRREGDAYLSPLNWPNWGGDKTWLSPQDDWARIGRPNYMGDPAWGEPIHGEHVAEPQPDGGLRVTGPVSAFSGLRVSRDYRLEDDELVIVQRVENVAAPGAMRCGLWPVTNVPRPDCFYAPPAASSAYPGGVRPMVRHADEVALGRAGPLVTFRPANRRAIKFGLDADHAALAARRDGEIFIQRGERPPGDYPDGAPELGGAGGLCVEYFDTGSAPRCGRPYAELELLGPLATLEPGRSATYTVRWSLLAAPADPAEEPDLERLAALLRRPVASAAASDWR